MKNLYCVLLYSFVSIFCFSQAPRIQWQRCLGGTSNDDIGNQSNVLANNEKPLAITSDNGYILGGHSSSNDGDVIGNHGGSDIWLSRLDQHGNTLWKKSYGGSSNELMGGVQETSDHGFIVVGSTNSSDGDVSGKHGLIDVWVLRLDDAGNIVWQKCFGGSKDDQAYNVLETQDGGYVFTGYTRSNNGDVSGLHIGVDSVDVWVVKLNSSGSILWQKCFGGSDYDEGGTISLTNDGGYILGNVTSSNDGDVNGFHGFGGSRDIWIVKLNEQGNISWNKCYGAGNGDEYIGNIKQAPDGGYIIAGSTSSPGGGDITKNNGNTDAWVVKLDSIGTIKWQKCYGGYFEDGASDVIELSNGNYIVCGNEMYNGGFPGNDIWVAELSSIGAIVWQKYYGSSGLEYPFSIVKSPDDGYLMLGRTGGVSDFDVIGKHGSGGTSDLWVVKLGSTNTIKGIAYFDRNLNGTKDADEPNITGGFVKSAKIGNEITSVPVKGLFTNTVDTGSYTTTINYSSYFTSVPASKASSFTTYNNKDSFSFALQAIPGKRDLTVSVVPLNIPRPGFDMSCRVYYKNIGTDTIANGEILFKKDSRFSFLSGSPTQSSISGDTIKWSYNDLNPLDTASILVRLRVAQPPTVNLNDTLSSIAIITPVQGDLTPSDDTAYLNQIVIGSYDPNDKSENLAGEISLREVSSSSYINYLIRFQNTGTDTAFNIAIRDTLDDKLDWNSLQMIASSHPYQLNIKSQNQLTWKFNNILLVDSNRSEPASHGFVAYRVKPKNNLVVGDIIRNRAFIYFDFNLPVETNIQETEVVMYSISNPQISAPTITAFTPVSAATGATVTITGTNLTGATAVSFGGTAATSFTVNSSTSITATIGTGASGDVSVTTPGGTAILSGFTFIALPTITSFTPTSGGTGASITITGTNFTGATAVSFGGTAATSFTVNSATSITAVVGTGATGNVSVTTPGGTVTLAGFTYTVVTAIDPVPGNSLGIRLYPNPVTTGSFVIDTLKLSDQWEMLEIYDTDGKKKLSSFSIKNKTIVTIPIEHLAKGFYTAILRRKNGQSAVIKFLKL